MSGSIAQRPEHRFGDALRSGGVRVQAVGPEELPLPLRERVQVHELRTVLRRDPLDLFRDLRDAVELRVVRDMEEAVERLEGAGRRADHDPRGWGKCAIRRDQLRVLPPEGLRRDPVAVLGIVGAQQDDDRVRPELHALPESALLPEGLVAGVLQRPVVDRKRGNLRFGADQALQHGRITAQEEQGQRAAVGHAVADTGDMPFSLFAPDGKPDRRIAAQDDRRGQERRKYQNNHVYMCLFSDISPYSSGRRFFMPQTSRRRYSRSMSTSSSAVYTPSPSPASNTQVSREAGSSGR